MLSESSALVTDMFADILFTHQCLCYVMFGLFIRKCLRTRILCQSGHRVPSGQTGRPSKDL